MKENGPGRWQYDAPPMGGKGLVNMRFLKFGVILGALVFFIGFAVLAVRYREMQTPNPTAILADTLLLEIPPGARATQLLNTANGLAILAESGAAQELLLLDRSGSLQRRIRLQPAGSIGESPLERPAGAIPPRRNQGN